MTLTRRAWYASINTSNHLGKVRTMVNSKLEHGFEHNIGARTRVSHGDPEEAVRTGTANLMDAIIKSNRRDSDGSNWKQELTLEQWANLHHQSEVQLLSTPRTPHSDAATLVKRLATRTFDGDGIGIAVKAVDEHDHEDDTIWHNEFYVRNRDCEVVWSNREAIFLRVFEKGSFIDHYVLIVEPEEVPRELEFNRRMFSDIGDFEVYLNEEYPKLFDIENENNSNDEAIKVIARFNWTHYDLDEITDMYDEFLDEGDDVILDGNEYRKSDLFRAVDRMSYDQARYDYAQRLLGNEENLIIIGM